MNNDTYIIFDANFLCYRAFHVHKDLSHGDIGTGVMFGVFRDIINMQEYHGTENVIFVFDTKRNLRSDLNPAYKARRKQARKELTGEEKLQRREFLKQVEWLREKYLYRLGYRNVFYEDGYEADDIIASLCHHTIPKNASIVIVSADKDLFQLLEGRISIWNPSSTARGATTLQTFYQKHGIMPGWWPQVKAIAGCTSDEISGVPGVGEKTAIKYLNKKLEPHLKTFQAIEQAKPLIKANLQLTTLPFPDTPVYELEPNKCSAKRWRKTCEALGIESLQGYVPLQGQAKHGKRKSKGRGFRA